MAELKKSSDEILNELFETINVIKETESEGEEKKKRKKSKKKKKDDKDRKKHKKKKHKHKKSSKGEKKKKKKKENESDNDENLVKETEKPAQVFEIDSNIAETSIESGEIKDDLKDLEIKVKSQEVEEGEISESEKSRDENVRKSSSQDKVDKIKQKTDKKEEDRKYRKRSRSRSRRSRSRSRRKSRSRSHSRSHRKRTPSKEHTDAKNKENNIKNDRKYRSKSRERHSRRRSRSRSRSRRKSKERHRRSRTPKRSKYDDKRSGKDEYFIDKSKLLEIARKNALNMMRQGQVGTDLNRVASITAGGKTVDELTDFCKLLSQKEATGQGSVSSETSSETEGERPFHHPFQLKERPNNIVMNIRNCAVLPVKTHQEKTTEHAQQLRLQFPVSSGQLHRKTESEWIPVKTEPKAIMPPPKPEPDKFPLSKDAEKTIPCDNIPLPPLPPQEPKDNFDLSAVISERLAAIRKQQESFQYQVPMWPGVENQAGLFTGSTGARVLTQAELASGQQAWARKDQLISAQPVSGGMGMSLLQKMGWKPGEGLGKNSEGSLEPLRLQVKMDKRGLVCAEELPKKQRIPPPAPKSNIAKNGGISLSIEGKHPVSLLVEYCTRRHFPAPIFTVCSEEGPAHKKNFIFKVTVNGMDYLPTVPSPNKKLAKSEAATLCLRKLGLLPFVVQM